MNSRAGTGEYSSTSTGPRRSASAPIADERADGVADVGGLEVGGDPRLCELRGELFELVVVAGDQADGHTFAPEAPRDGRAEVRACSDDDDGHGWSAP